ncbi:hypothetical protein J2129_000500 [Methanofollis sp. W23]|uniref:hypothetical protein n=1 Tax=Methanofollis sp. W23 TaxID=2817849 RepID=UPI001AE8804F|nr:hypothetical protein [Methanofollis sp. W23]MBP2145046.1 hypothetical protein [Methanofollis sp. W23]
MKSFIRYRQALFLLALLFWTVPAALAADPVVLITCSEPLECNGLEVSEVSFLDLIDPAVTRTMLDSTTGDDQKVLACPAVRAVSRDFPDATIRGERYTVTTRSVPGVDWTGVQTYPVYRRSVVPSVSTAIPGKTGNVVLMRIPPEVQGTPTYEALFAGTDTMYLYAPRGIVYINPRSGEYISWGEFNGTGYDPCDSAATMANTRVDLGRFSVDPARARAMGEAHPGTLPPPGEYLWCAFRYDQETCAMEVLGMTPVFVMDQDRAMTWNGGDVPATYAGGNVTLGFEDGESLDGMVYFIFRKDTSYEAEMRVDCKTIMAMIDHPRVFPVSLIDFLIQKVPGDGVEERPVRCTLRADGAAKGGGDSGAVLPVSAGYGTSGVGEGQEVTVPASALSGLTEGIYIVTLCGAGRDGAVFAFDQEEIAVGANARPGRSHDGGGSSDWSGPSKRVGPCEEMIEIQTMAPKSSEGEVKNPGGAAAVKEIGVWEDSSKDPAEPAGKLPAVLGYLTVLLIALLGIGIAFGRKRFR